MSNDYYSDEDQKVIYDKKTLYKIHKINSYQLNDYMKCNFTKNILEEYWERDYNDELGNKIDNIFTKHYEYLHDQNKSNIMYRANMTNLQDLHNIIKHNLYKEYSRKPFIENPDLINPLISKLEKDKGKKIIKKPLKKYKKYDWNK
jgi:hypothetical protein